MKSSSKLSRRCCELGHVLREVLLCLWFLRQTHGRSARIVFCRVDVKEAFRQVMCWLIRSGRRCSVTLPAEAWSWICGCSSGGGIALGTGACWLPRVSKPTPALRFKAPLCPRKGPPPSCMLELPRRGGFRWCRSRVIVAPFLGTGGNAGSYFFVRYYVDDARP